MPENALQPARALLLTRNFPPLVGGMEKVNRRLLLSMVPGWEVALCGPRGCGAFAPEAITVRELPSKPLLRFLLPMLFHSLAVATRIRPRLVLAGSGLTAPFAWLAARLVGARSAVYLHGLDIVAPSRIYHRVWLPFIRATDLVIVNSTNTARIAVENGVRRSRIEILNPGADVPTLDLGAHARFRERHALENQPVLLSVGRLTLRKGLAEFVARCLPGIVRAVPSAVLVIIGDDAVDALHGSQGSERERITLAAREAGVERHLLFLGHCDEALLAEAYQSADCHVFPVLQVPGDVEGFGMVALESAAHGLRTVAFDVGGVADAVADARSGRLVASGDYASFADAAIRYLEMPASALQVIACREFAMQKSWACFASRLQQLLPAGEA